MRWRRRENSLPVFLLRRLVRRSRVKMRLYLRMSDLLLVSRRLSRRARFRLSPLFLRRFLTRRLLPLFALTLRLIAFFLSLRSFGRRNPLNILLSLRRSFALRRLLFLLRPLSFNSLRISLSARRCFLRGSE